MNVTEHTANPTDEELDAFFRQNPSLEERVNQFSYREDPPLAPTDSTETIDGLREEFLHQPRPSEENFSTRPTEAWLTSESRKYGQYDQEISAESLSSNLPIEKESSSSTQVGTNNSAAPKKLQAAVLLPEQLRAKASKLVNELEGEKKDFFERSSNQVKAKLRAELSDRPTEAWPTRENQNSEHRALLWGEASTAISTAPTVENIPPPPEELADRKNLSKEAKKALLPHSPLWNETIEDALPKTETGFSCDYSITTIPRHEGDRGVCRRDDLHSMNAWSVQVKSTATSAASESGSALAASGEEKPIYSSLRSAAWVPKGSKEIPPGRQRLLDNMTSAAQLQVNNPKSEIAQAINREEFGLKNTPLSLKILSNSLLSTDLASVKNFDFEGTLESKQRQLIEWANTQAEPFELEITVGDEKKTLWVEPDILMLNTPVQQHDRFLINSMGASGVNYHEENMKVVEALEQEVRAYNTKLFEEIDQLRATHPLTLADKKKLIDLALELRVVADLSREIKEMAEDPFNTHTGMYGENYGNPHAFNSRLKALYYRLGRISVDNCKTGKDRTEDSQVATDLLVAELEENVKQERTRLYEQYKLGAVGGEDTFDADDLLSMVDLPLPEGVKSSQADLLLPREELPGLLGEDKESITSQQASALSLPLPEGVTSSQADSLVSREELPGLLGEDEKSIASQRASAPSLGGESVVQGMPSFPPLVPRRDFLSKTSLLREIKALEIKTFGNDITACIEHYSPHQPDQENLYAQIRGLFGPNNPIPSSLKELLERFEQTAHRRIAFALNRAGATIQLLNNKEKLIYGNKQPRYPNYLFGLSSAEIKAYEQLMSAKGAKT